MGISFAPFHRREISDRKEIAYLEALKSRDVAGEQ